MPAKGRADDGAVAGDDVEDAFGQAGFGGDFRQAQRAQGSLAGGLDDDAVAGGKDGAEFPGGHLDGEIPRQDGAHDPERFADDHGDVAGAGGGNLVILLVGDFGVPAETMDGIGDVHGQAVGDGFAGVEGVEQGQFIEIFFEEVGKMKEKALALGGGAFAPDAFFKGAAGGGDGPVHVGAVAGGDFGQRLAGGRVDGVVGLAGGGVDELAVNEGAGAELEFGSGGLDGFGFKFQAHKTTGLMLGRSMGKA